MIPEQKAQHVYRRASATAEELASRRTNAYPVANNHRAGHFAGLHPEDQPYLSDDVSTDPPKMPRSAIRYQRMTAEEPPAILDGKRKYVLRRSLPGTQQARQTTQPRTTQQRQPRRRSHHSILPIGIGMIVMFVLWVAGMMAVSWWQVTQDDIHYGRPRTYQTDMVVGHADSASHPSHFIALNSNRQIEVIEFPGGDASKAKIYLVATLIGDGQDLAIVTLTFKDINGDGKVDMIVNVKDSHYPFLNDQGQFRPAKPGEHVSL